jgi:predicted phosphate transport protein (TIGR00153 family)
MKLFPIDVHFSDSFEELADKIQEGGMVFVEILNDFGNSKDKIPRLKEIEHEADMITHRIYQDLHKTFITPLDREDIYSLANKMDSIVDMIDESASKMQFYRIKEPLSDHKLLATILNKSIALVSKSIYAMRNRRANINMILEHCIEINSLENEADHVLRQSMAQLFEREKNAIELIKCKDILDRIEETTDLCEDVSNIIEGIILKYG